VAVGLLYLLVLVLLAVGIGGLVLGTVRMGRGKPYGLAYCLTGACSLVLVTVGGLAGIVYPFYGTAPPPRMGPPAAAQPTASQRRGGRQCRCATLRLWTRPRRARKRRRRLDPTCCRLQKRRKQWNFRRRARWGARGRRRQRALHPGPPKDSPRTRMPRRRTR